MKEGNIFYQGSSANLVSYFSQFGYNCPTNYNPADYVMLLSQTESMESIEKSGIMDINKVSAAKIGVDIRNSVTTTEHFFPDQHKASFLKVSISLTYYICFICTYLTLILAN